VQRTSALDVLAELYARARASTSEGDAMLRGHLAVLLGLLMRAPPNAAALLRTLPGATRRARIDALLAHVRDFVGLYEDFMGRLGRQREDDEDTEHVGGVGKRANGAGGEVARDVVMFLEELRDR
jgi:hypothetical protein